MPKSRSRDRGAEKRRYQLGPTRRKARAGPSPRWYAPLVLGIMGLGAAVIITNYLGILPFTNRQTSPPALLVGLLLIGAGFLGTTKIR